MRGNFNELLAAENEDAINIWYQWNFTEAAFTLGGPFDNPNLISNRPLRISELVDLSVENVNFEAKTFTIYRSKNTKTRVLSLPSETWDELKEYKRRVAQRKKPF